MFHLRNGLPMTDVAVTIGGNLPHLTLLRGLLGTAGLASCITLLASSQASAADYSPSMPQRIVITGHAPVPPNLFDTITLPVRADRYALQWERARLDASHVPAMRALIAPVQGLSRRDQLFYIQAAVQKRIRWISDATEWGTHDYWASARETLERGAGDAEDRAIVKMQALRALGVPASDLYLTIGKERIGGPPITVLLARIGGSYYLLDDWSGPPIPIERKRDFEPIISFSGTSSWLHGKRHAAGGSAAGLTTSARK